MKETISFWQSAIDPMYRETLEYCHPGKDIDQAIRESFGYLSADPHRLNVMEPSEFKRFVNGWLSKMRFKDGFRKKSFDINNL